MDEQVTELGNVPGADVAGLSMSTPDEARAAAAGVEEAFALTSGERRRSWNPWPVQAESEMIPTWIWQPCGT